MHLAARVQLADQAEGSVTFTPELIRSAAEPNGSEREILTLPGGVFQCGALRAGGQLRDRRPRSRPGQAGQSVCPYRRLRVDCQLNRTRSRDKRRSLFEV